jgi:protein ImuB
VSSPPPERIACADLPAFPLQLVLRAHPEWREDPVVVVEDDRATAAVLWANRAARAQRIAPGLRFAQAQSLAARVRAAVVPVAEVEAAVAEVHEVLLRLSPHVEPSRERPGVFWLDPNGLERIHESVERWASRVRAALESLGFTAAVVVGWHPFRALAVARHGPGVRVLAGADAERALAARVPLARLAGWKLAQDMELLGVATLGDFLRLPRGGVRDRYGQEAAALHDLASGRAWIPFRPELPEEPVRVEVPVEPPDDDPARLLFGLKAALHPAVEEIGARGRGVAALALALRLDHAGTHAERIETAAPTLDVVRLLDLVRLRLCAAKLAAPVEHVTVTLETRPVHARQAALLPVRVRRDRAAAARAIARLVAAFGEGAVARARLVDAHLPEARFLWEPLRELPEAAAVPPVEEGEIRPLARNLLHPPAPLPDPPRHETERWLGRHGAVEAMHGPVRVGTGWWDIETERDYFHVETRTGEVLWIFQDRLRRGWFLQGMVD